MRQHFFDLETFTLILGILGHGMSIWGLLSAITDLNYLTAMSVNGARRIVAYNNITRQAFRMAIQVVIIAAGAYGCTHRDYSHETGTSMLLSFIVMIALMVFVGEILDRIRRVQLDREYDRSIASLRRRRTDATLAAIIEEHK